MDFLSNVVKLLPDLIDYFSAMGHFLGSVYVYSRRRGERLQPLLYYSVFWETLLVFFSDYGRN